MATAKTGSVAKPATVAKTAGGAPGPGRPTVVPYKFGVRRPQPYSDNRWVPVNPFIQMKPKPQAMQAAEAKMDTFMPARLMPDAMRAVNARKRQIERKV